MKLNYKIMEQKLSKRGLTRALRAWKVIFFKRRIARVAYEHPSLCPTRKRANGLVMFGLKPRAKPAPDTVVPSLCHQSRARSDSIRTVLITQRLKPG